MATKYFIICGKRLVKATSNREKFFLANEAYEYVDGAWLEINRNEVNDRLMGYDSTEDTSMYAMGNTDIMEEIIEIDESDVEKYL